MLVYNVTCNLFKLNIKRGLRKQIKKNMKRNYRVHHTKSQIEVFSGDRSIVLLKDDKASELIKNWIEKTPTFSAISNLILTSEELTVIETIE